MASLTTSYMGISLSSPIIVGACQISEKTDKIKKCQDAGAGALVIHSLFQEQIEREAQELENDLMQGSYLFAEALTYFAALGHAGAREHVMWIEKALKEVNMPLIGSLNATTRGGWVDYARQMAEAGCSGIELNIYSIETSPNVSAVEIEKRTLDVIAAVKDAVNIPIAVKLGPWYTSVANFAHRAAAAGADALVLFNRFYQPTIDPDTEFLVSNLELSRPEETRLPLRWAAILSGNLTADISVSTGVHSGKDALRHLLAGAKSVQIVSALLKNGIGHITAMNTEIAAWMDDKGYADIDSFRGKLSQNKLTDPLAFERIQYAKIISSHNS